MKRYGIAAITLILALALVSIGCAGQAPPQGFAGIVTDGEMLLVGTSNGRIVALDPEARQADVPFPAFGEWSHAITKETRGSFGCGTSQVASVLYGTPVVVDGHMCIGTYDGKVLMLESTSRASELVFPQLRAGEWLFPRTEKSIGPVVGSPAVTDDVVYISSSIKEGSKTHGVVYALDREFGDELWVSETLDGKLWVTPAVADGVVYVSTFEGRVYSLDGVTGAVLPWVFEGEFGFVSSPHVVDGMLYVGSFDRSLSAIPLGADAPAWRFQAGNWFWAAPLVLDGVVYAASLDGSLYALDAQSGSRVWTTAYDAGDPIAAAPVLAGDNLVVVTQKGDVHVVNRSSGLGARVPHPTNDRATTCNAAVIAGMCYLDGVVYVRSQDNVLHAINPLARTVDYSFSLKME